MLPTLLAAAGVPDVKEQLLKGMKVGDKTFKVHLDGYNITDALAGKSPSPRHEFFYFNDDGSLVGLRYDQWKIVFAEQRAEGFDVWQEPFVPLRLPKIFNLRSDPFEKADHIGIGYNVADRPHLPARAGAADTSGSSSPRSRNSRRARKSAASARPGAGEAPEGRRQRPVIPAHEWLSPAPLTSMKVYEGGGPSTRPPSRSKRSSGGKRQQRKTRPLAQNRARWVRFSSRWRSWVSWDGGGM